MLAEYACGDAQVVRTGNQLSVRGDDSLQPASLGWHDDAGDHFVTWPVSPTDVEAIEFVVPTDGASDASRRVYDTSKGVSTADWRLTHKQTCTAKGGYSDALALYMRSENIDALAQELGTDRDEARRRVRTALTSLQKRYWRDR